jgi:hypothetical protein
MGIELGWLHHPVGREQPVHQVLQAIHLGNDHLGVFAELRVVQFALQQLGRAADATEGILDLVSQIADQFAARLLLVRELLLACHLKVRVHRTKLQKQARIDRIDRCDRAIELQGLHPGAYHGQVVSGVAPVIPQNVVECIGQPERLAKQATQGVADYLATARSKQVFCPGVQIANDEFIVHQHHGRRQQLEAGEGRGRAGGLVVLHMGRSMQEADHLPAQSSTHRQARRRRRLAEICDFLAQCLDVALVDLHFVLVGLQALKGLLVVTLVGADAFLGGKIPSGGIEGSLLVGQFLVEDAAPVAVTRLLGARIDLRKTRRRG